VEETSFTPFNCHQLFLEHLTPFGTPIPIIDPSSHVRLENPSNWVRTRNIFKNHFKQVHLSPVSSNIGADPLYINKHLVGGSATLAFGPWASKVSFTPIDESGFGTFSITSMQGKGRKHVSFISAYIGSKKDLKLVLNHCMHNRSRFVSSMKFLEA